MPKQDKIDQLYDALKADGAVSKSRENFRSYMLARGKQGYMNRKKLYDALKADGAVESATYEEFRDRLGLGAVKPQQYVASPSSSPHGVQKPAPQQDKPKPKLQKAKQPQKQGGRQPTWQQKMGMQMQLDETMRNVRQSQQDFNTRMENMRKGNALGKTSDVKFSPESGKMERRYYTTHGDEVATPTEQSRLNLKYRDEWEATTQEGRKHREMRIENDFERRVGASLDKYDPDNAAAMVWQQAEDKANEEFGRYLEERSKLSLSNFIRGAADGMNVTGGLGADNVDTGIQAFATHLKYHDLQRMADDAWNMLGKEKQQSIIEDMYGALKNRYPQATEQQLQQAATEMAREQSDRRMYELAVAKNAPKDAAEYFIRKVAAGNAMETLMQAAARAQAGTTGDWEEREDAEQRFEKQGHKFARIAGTVTGVALDPLIWASAGAGGAAVKGTTWLGGKMIGEAAMRKFGTTLGGRMLGGAIGGAVNFGTYEAGSEALDQMKWGGYIDEETGERKEGFSFGNVAGRAGHGLMMGAVTGVIAPYLGNVSDKLVRATESTVGKMGIRAGELGVGTVAEGTIFAVPEIIDTYGQYGDLINSLSDESSPNYIADEQERAAKIEELRNSRGDALMDVWTDNMAMIAGFKAQHLLKSAPRVIYDLARSKNGKAGFETRLRSILDGRGDLALTEDEKKELERRGYGDLKDLTEEYSRYAEAKEKYDKARPTTTDARRMIEGGDGQAELPYNRFVELMNDKSISEAARAKMYYYLTGHGLPMSTVMGSSILEDKDADGNVTGYTVQSFGTNGVITSRSFGDKKRADVEVNRINRQAELNGFDVGERYYDWQGDNKRMFEACETVAEETGAPANLLFDLMKRKTEAMNEVELEWAEKILNAYNGLGDKYGSSEVRAAINDEFGIDVDKAIRKEPGRRSEQEQKAVDEYANRLFADVKRKQEEAAERGEAPVDPDAPTSNSQIAALLGIDDGEQGDPVSAAFNRGHEADAQERQDIAIELADPNNAEAQEAWNGVVQRINEDAAYMVAQQREQTKQMQHIDGSLRPAILKEKDSEGKDQQVYIVDGNVQMMPDGSMVDKEASDNIVVIYNPATGERKQIDPSADTGISSLGEVTTAEQREVDIERMRQEYVQSQIDEAQGTVRLAPGQQIVLPTGEEAVVQALFEDGSAVVNMGDGTIQTVDIKELQRIRDEKALADYRQRHGIDEAAPASQHTEQPQGGDPAAKPLGTVAGAPADYTTDMELTIRDEDGSEKPAMVMGRVRYENGRLVPDENGKIIEYYMDGEVKHDHEDKLASKVVSHVAPVQPEHSNNTLENIPVQGNNAGENIPQTPIETPAPAEPTNVEQPTEVAPQQVQEPVQTVEPQLAQPTEAPAQPANADESNLDITSRERVQDTEPMPVREDGEEDWQATTPERAHAYIFNEAGLSRSEGNEFIAAQTQAAQSALAKAKSAQMPRVGTSIKKYNEAKAKRQEKIDEAQRVLNYWNGVREIQNAVQREENERRAAEDAVRHDEAVAQVQADYEARKEAEAERKAVGNENPMPAITEKWHNAAKVDGNRDEIMLPDGTPLKGHYVLHESGASSPSHNPETWQMTDGFPMDANDNSVNDRDYERDRDAQEHTRRIARQYDQRALQSVPVVSNDGVVLSGNGRTMAGELAARDNTDGAYLNYLKEYAPKFGFTAEQVEGMKHPRVSFVPDEAMPYTAETFARFNQQEMKSQNKTEQSVKLGKTVGDESFRRIVRTINGYDTLGDFYNDAQASLGAVSDLHHAGVIPQAQLAEMVDGVRGQEKLSAVGREFLENMLIGKAFDGEPDVVRMLTAEPAMRQAVITALGEIVDNIALGDGYSLQGQLADAVRLCFDARNGGAKYGEIVSTYARQGVLFADPDELQTVADFNNATMLMLADALNDKRVTQLKIMFQLYNKDARESAAGQIDMFAGVIKSPEEILRGVIKFINENYGRRKEIEAAQAAAVERRKADSVQENGTPPASSGGSEKTGGSAYDRHGYSQLGSGRQGALETSVTDEERTSMQARIVDWLSDENLTAALGKSRTEIFDLFGNALEPIAYIPSQYLPLISKDIKDPRIYCGMGYFIDHALRNHGLDGTQATIEDVDVSKYLNIQAVLDNPDAIKETFVDGKRTVVFVKKIGRYFAELTQVEEDGKVILHKSLFSQKKEPYAKLNDIRSEKSSSEGGTSSISHAAEATPAISLQSRGDDMLDTSVGKDSENPSTNQAKDEKVAENQGAGSVQASLAAAEAEGKRKGTGAPQKDNISTEEAEEPAANATGTVAAAITEAEAATEVNPTDAQKAAGNYKKGHVRIDGYDITIENPKGSVRRGTDADGKQWEQEMQNTYGYIRGTEGVDGDHIDVFFSEDPSQGDVFVVDQVNKDGSFDEHKVMYGFPDIESARKAYLSNYEDGWQGLGAITPVSKEEFKKWIDSSHRKTKPFAEYSSVKPLGDTQLGEQQTAGYSIEPTTYTNKKGKTTPMHLVTFGRELSKDEIRAGKELAKESRGWWDKEKGGFMMRDEDSAKALAEALSNEEAVQDAQPLSVEDVATVTDQADMKAVDDAIKVEQEPQTTPQYDYDREDDVYDKTLTGLRNVLNDRKRGAIPNIKSIENVIRDLRKRAKTIEDGMATAAGETIPQAFEELANLTGKRRAYEQFLSDIRKKMAETERDDSLAAHGVKLGDKIMYNGKEATIHDADAKQVILDTGLAPVLYEVTDWENVELPKPVKEANADEVQDAMPMEQETPQSEQKEDVSEQNTASSEQEQPKQEEKKAKSKWVDDADAERFEELRRRLRQKLGGQLNMGVDPEAFALGVEMSYLMLKHGARKFAEFAKQMIEALGENVRPYLKSFYNGARDLPEMAEYEKELTPYDEVRTFDVMNFDKEGAKDIVATAEHIVREQAAEREAKEATDKLKQERNEQRKETEQEVAANTEALASEAATVASEVESKLPSARSEQEVNDLAKSIDDAIDKVNDQLALLGYYEAEPVESDFNEAYGYMRNAEKKAVKNVTELFKTLTKELGISDPVVYDTKGKKQKSVTANIAPAGGDVTMRFMLNRDKGVELYIDFMLEPDYENNRDNLVLKGIMFRPEKNLPNGGRDYLRANNFFPVDVTMPQMLHGIRSVCQEWLPAEDYVAMAQRIAAKNKAKTKENKPKTSKSKKKSVSLREQTIPDLFSGLFSEDLKPTSNEQEVHVQPRSSTTERERGHQREQNESLGEIKQNEDERPDTGRVAGRSGNDTKSDTTGGSRVSEPSDGKQNVKPVKPEPAPLAESERKNTHNNHAERGTDYAPKGTSARIEANIKAIETMQRLIESGEPATPEDMSVLRKFSGWGGLGAAFKEKVSSGDSGYNPRLRDDYQPANPINARLRELLSPEAYEAANMSRNSAYYTPAPVIDAMWDVARAMGFRGGNVLEGSAGIGNIIGLMPTDMSERSNIHAVEIDETTGNILSLLYPDANVEVKGFEKTFVPNGSVDLAITNVPFVTGLRVMDETGDKDLSRKFHDIHDFCIAKNVRKLKEGGVGIFITSSGTLDSPNSAKLRTWLVNDGGADVVGAFRMHNQTFGGTGATSDIIVIRKRVTGRKSANAIDVSGTLPIRTVKYNTGETKRGSSEVVIKDLALDVNKHFVEHPEDMAGEMAFAFEKGDSYRATSKALYPSPSINQEQRLSEWAQQFKDMDWDKAEERESQQVVYEDLGEDVKEGSMLLDSDGNLCLAQRGKAVPINVNANKVKGHTKAECFNAYKAIKDALADVLEYQTTHSDDSGLQQRLAKLNKAYDSFVKTYGHLNKNTSISFLRSDMDYPSIAALESVSETGNKSGKRIVTYGKTDIFSRRVVETESEPKPTTIKDGIIASIYLNGRVDVPYIAEQLNMSDSDVRQQIIESGLGFENPTTTEMEVSYEYLSGNVREKLRQAQENNTDGRYDANIKALERVIPMNIPAHLIEFTLGSSWVEPKLYEDFVKERTGLDVKLTNAGGTWIMSEPYYTNTEQNKAMGVISEKCDKTILGHELIKAAITCKSISVTKTISTGYGSSKTTETIVDKEATMACANKIDEIRQDFKDWARGKMQGDPEMSERMERVYNELFNNSVPKEIPDDFVPEHFGGAATVVNGKPFKLRPHQAKAVIRSTTQPLMLAHEVGTGKTYTLISTAMEMRRLGTARKPMIVVQNATVGQFVASAKALYPNAKILTLEDADRNAEGRRNFYAKIRYNDWDMIVVPQSVFQMIPDSEERQIRFVEDKIEEKMAVLEKMREAADNDRDPVLRQAQRELEQLEEERNNLQISLRERKGNTEKDEKREAKTRQNAMVKAQEMLDRETDDVANFDDMGIDALLIDEAHEYKHLGFATAMQRGVKGVDPSYSKKSQGVYLKTQAVLESKNGKNVVFATGTPISNTAAEIWTFMRYLMPADTMREYGIYYFDDFVRNFGNIQQMLEFGTNGKYKENNRFAGYVNLPELVRIWGGVADTVLTREAGGVSDKIPKMEGEKAQDIYLPQTKALRSVMKFVKDQLDDYENMSGKEKKENSHIPLTMYGIAQAAAVDPRLVLEDAADEPNSKTNEAVRQTLRSLEDTKEYNGTVAIFADRFQNKSTGFNLYEDIRQKLIAAGVPETQVVVVNPGWSVKKKLEIFDKVNRGEVRVIMGSTATLGTGVNIQERLHTLIHVDAPNRPMDYTQRNGRILRQGNLHNEWGIPVRVLRFGVEDSLDVTAYQRLKTKGAIADSIMEGKKMMSNSMENRVLEEEQDLFGDITAQLSGSQYALLKNQVEKEVRKLEARKKQWEADQTYVHNQKPRLKALIKDSEERAKRNKEALARVEAAKNDGITIGKMKFPSLDAMGDYIKDYNSKQREQQEQVRTASGYQAEAKSDLTVSVGGFDFHIHRVISKEQKQEKGQLSLSFFSKTQMTYSCPELGLEDVPVDGQRLKSALDDIIENVLSGDDFREKAEYADRDAERYKGELKQVEARDGKPFEYADELKQAKEKLAEYEELMKAEMAEKEAKYAEMDASVEAAKGVQLSDEEDGEITKDGDMYRDGEYDDDIEQDSTMQEDRDMMRSAAEQMGEKLHTNINIIEDVNEITHPNTAVQERRRKSKGWYDTATGQVYIVLPNNRDVDDVKASVGHETIAHKGLRELVGEERYDEFLDETYQHLRDDLKKGVDDAAGRAFVDDATKNGERAKSYEQHRRTAVDELFGRLAEKPFEEFSDGERTLWQKIKATVRRLLDKFLGSLKLPKWFELGDNELRYILWRSKERLERGREHPIDLARDIVKRDELGLTDEARYNMGDAPETFKARQKRAVENNGTVMPGLNDAQVKVVDVPRHSFTGTGRQAIDKAKIWANVYLVGTHTAHQIGNVFDYNIDKDAIDKFLSSSSTLNSENLGVHLAVLSQLPNVINNSVEVEEHPDYKKVNGKRKTENGVGDSNLLVHRMYGAVQIDGNTYRVKTTMHEHNVKGNAPHDYRVTKIELLISGSPTSNALSNSIGEVLNGQTTKPLSVSSRKSNTPNSIELLDSTDGERTGLSSSYQSNSNGVGSHPQSEIGSSYPLAKLLQNLEKSYDTGKKLLDESKLADESTDLYRDLDDTDDISPDGATSPSPQQNSRKRGSAFGLDDVWIDGSLGLQERITAAATRLANNHREDKTLRNDAMRAIGGNLSDLRKAMSLQRTFDMTTVKRVADLARVLITNGYINNATSYEIKRLLSAVKNSVGHNDIEGDVQKVMDIMVDNQLKHAEETLHSLEAIKGSKVDARGVEVQGQLDPDGQTLIKAMKEAQKIVNPCGGKTHDEKGEPTAWGDALESAQMRMSSNDQAVADAAAIEYAGMQMAQQWFDSIQQSKLEEITLRKELKNAHEKTSERERATDSYRQYIASVEEAIRQNKIERVQAYYELVGRLSDSLRESIANAKDFKEAEKQRIREIQHNANSDMEGRPSDEHYKPTFADKFVNNSFVSFLFAPLATFDQMLRMFGGKSANGEGYLYNRFMRGWVDARQQEINGVRDKYAILDKKAAELFGGKVKTWGDLIRRVGKLPKGSVSFWNGGEMQDMELTQGNLMYIYMVNKMLDGRMKLRKMGITEENVSDIEEVLDPRLIELADWLQDEFLVQTRNEYNETHKRMFGASMAAIEHYFPLKILANARADKPEDLDNPDKNDGISTATGSIIKRRRNALALDITGADALSVILDHVAQMEHWNAFAEFNRDINTLRSYKRFRNQVQNMTTIYGSGKELWKKFNDVCQMASGTYRPPRTKLDEAAVNFAKGVTAAKVSFRIFTALKQFLSMPAYLPEARTDYLLRNIANPVGAWKWSMEHLPIFNERWRSRMSGDPRLLKSDMDWKMWRTRIMQLASRAGMSPNAFVDALTVSIGAHAMYQTRKAQYLRDGYSEADAEKKAVQDAEVLYNQTQQSSEGAFTSTIQVDRSWLSVLFTVFRNASMSYQRQLHDALRNFKHNLTPGGRARSIEFMTKQLLRDKGIEPQTDGNWSDADWQREEQVAKRKFRRQLLKDTLRIATFGYIMQFAWNLGAYLPYLLFGDDDETKDEFWDDIWTHTMGGWLEGLTGGDVMSLGIGMWLSGEVDEWKLKKEMPLTSDLLLVWQKLDNGQHAEALNDMINLIVQAGIAVNPQSITDGVLAIMDACGDDPALAHEATICISRILQVPQSQIDKMYFDEVGLSGDEVSKYTPGQLAERYAMFKVKRERLFSPRSWGDDERIWKLADKAYKTINERIDKMGDKKVNEAYMKYEEVYKGVAEKVKEANKAGKTDYVQQAEMMDAVYADKDYETYETFKTLDKELDDIVKCYLGAKTPDEAALCRQAVLDYKSAMVKVLEATDEAQRQAAMGSLGTMMQDFYGKYNSMQQPNR